MYEIVYDGLLTRTRRTMEDYVGDLRTFIEIIQSLIYLVVYI